MVITWLRRTMEDYAHSEWEGEDDAGACVVVRCKPGLVELRAHPRRRPSVHDVVDFVLLADFNYMQGALSTYGQVKDALAGRGHVLPAEDGGTPDTGRLPSRDEDRIMAEAASLEVTARPATREESAASRDGRTITIRRPNDFHAHFRQGDVLRRVAPLHAHYFGYVLAMPNTDPPIRTADQASDYYMSLTDAMGEACAPLKTIMLTDQTTPETIISALNRGVVAAKLYPKLATNNSGEGVERIVAKHLWPVYDAMEEYGMVLCGHFEEPGAEILERERECIPILEILVGRWPGLRIVVEHVTTAEMAGWIIKQHRHVAGTITPQHLVCTLDDVIGAQGMRDYWLTDGGPSLATGRGAPALRPHNYCLPVPKMQKDRRRLIEMALSGLPQFFLGTDSAPHEPAQKECAAGKCGVFVPGKVALAVLAWVFESCTGDDDWHVALEQFASENGARFYDLPLIDETITFRRRDWTVPAVIEGFVPFAANRVLPWEPLGDDDDAGS